MQGKFEKNIEQKLSDFSLEPSPHIWQNVKVALPPHRKYRGMLWWWWGLLGLMMAGGCWWLLNSANQSRRNIQSTSIQNIKVDDSVSISDKNKKTKNISNLIQQQKVNSKEQSEIQEEDLNSYVSQKAKVLPVKKKDEPQGNKDFENEITEQKEQKTILTNPQDELISADTIKEKGVLKLTTVSQKMQKEIDTSISINTTAIAEKTELSSTKNIIDTIISSKNKQDTVIFNSVTENTSHEKIKNKKQQWSITLGVGNLNVNSSGFLTGQNSQAYSPANYSSGTSFYSNTIPKPQQGFNLLVGIKYEYSINKRWNIYSGLQYRYVQNKQAVGADSIANNGNIYYTTGSSLVPKNYAHWLQIPFGFSYGINPSAKNKFQLLFGGSFAWAFAEKWLVTDLNNSFHPYYYNTTLNNHAVISVHTGIGYNSNNRFQISLMAEQALNPIHLQISNKYYQQLLYIQISKPLHPNLKKKNN